MKRILILGASGFIGNALYKELNSYYDTFGTYFNTRGYKDNRHFFQFDVNEGENSIRIPMEGQARGSYILHLKVSNRTFSKVVIKR